MTNSALPPVDHEILIIGAGFSGIGVAIKLDEAGMHDFRIVEAGEGAGGTWHWNTYPGIGVDIPSFSYQFSFEKKPDWSHVYAKGAELKAYAEHCVDKYGLRSRFIFDTKIARIHFEEDAHRWRLSSTDGREFTARYVINATGVLSEPNEVRFNGIDDFTGPIVHTARWDHTLDLKGKRVGVIGTGASSVQVVPAVAPEVTQLTVFQRTPIWCIAKHDRPLSPRMQWTLAHLPGTEMLARIISQGFVETILPLAVHYHTLFPITKYAEYSARRMLARQVHDPGVREKLTPQYGFGCKRPSFSNDYLPAFNRTNVHLETAGIDRITPTGVRTVDGVEHELDVIILATGFKLPYSPGVPYECVGTDGIDLDAFWAKERVQAYEGVSIPHFPNLFAMFAPYGYNGSSYFTLIEVCAKHIVRALDQARRVGATRVEITGDANTRYFEEMMRRRKRQVFWQDSCREANSYYYDRNGDVPLRPVTTIETYWRSGHFDLTDYRFDRWRPTTTEAADVNETSTRRAGKRKGAAARA
ncbi:Predicted flavoprotein CzcO associated with the cation diffusion facilitator CzcD [Nocardia amikacinitolerans]|uniref:Predicted flavoprotein CzcO associated with the cation diffusion facilitator CzcD n=1 Tax=Nocardia amikacinitolerans TaxID=756689 RepID=A0A285L2V5_9NOCA|nr:Predicted flavoprotein CzcO associated with the cation diffusion facilitator CzcD [Nocardia amikacinitolerans]